MGVKKYIKDYFDLSRSELNGIAALLVIILVLAIVRFLMPVLFSRNEKDYSKIIEENRRIIDKLRDSLNAIEIKQRNTYQYRAPNQKHKREQKQLPKKKRLRSNFNPNTASPKILLDLGFKKNVVSNLIKYRQSGGVFYSGTDLYKIYSIDSALVKELLPYVVINNSKKKYPGNVSQKKMDVKIDLNNVKAEELMMLYGIGEVLSKRIIKYRNLLGGFYCIDQLSEVYGLDEKVVQKNANNIVIDTNKLSQIDLNFCQEKDLSKHPYVSIEASKKILGYRSKNGAIKKVIQLQTDSVIDADTYCLISPYLTVGQ